MIEVFKQALEALELCTNAGMIPMYLKANQTAITSLRQAIAKLESQGKTMKVEGLLHVVCQCDKCKTESQEPMLLFQSHRDNFWCVDLTCKKCYSADFRLMHTHPPKRTWVWLTDEEIQECLKGLPTQTIDIYARRIEAKLKEKNHD